MIEGTAPAPVRVQDRIQTLDLLRGVAICGILLMNIPAMGLIGDRDGPAFPAAWNADWISWGIQSLCFDGTMRGLFEMLFGAGMLLVLRKAEGVHGQVAPFDVWARRCWALMFLGVVQWAVFLWPGEILWCYGLSGLFLLAFRTARPRALLIAAAILLVAFSAYNANKRYQQASGMVGAAAAIAAQQAHRPLTDAQKALVKKVEEARKANHPSPAAIAKEYGERTHLVTLEKWSWNFWQEFNLSSEGWAWLLESVGFMLIGMALFRLDILTGAAPLAVYRWFLLGYPLGIALRVLLLWHQSLVHFDFDPARINPTWSAFNGSLYQVTRLLITLGHIGLLVLLFRTGALGRATPLRALGRMALTVYSLQSILTSLLFYGFGLLGRFGFAGLMATAAAIWIVTGLFCLWWLKRHDMGPAERFLRGIAYGTFPRWERREADQLLAAAPAV